MHRAMVERSVFISAMLSSSSSASVASMPTNLSSVMLSTSSASPLASKIQHCHQHQYHHPYQHHNSRRRICSILLLKQCIDPHCYTVEDRKWKYRNVIVFSITNENIKHLFCILFHCHR